MIQKFLRNLLTASINSGINNHKLNGTDSFNNLRGLAMTDNFELIKEFIKSQWDGQFDLLTDVFYMVEIIGRTKDNSQLKSHKFKTYYIKTVDDLDKYKSEIKLLCDTLQMRAYFSVNAKSEMHVALNTIAEYANRMAQHNLYNSFSVFESCAAKYVERSDQLWIVDVDKEDADARSMSVDELTAYYTSMIEDCEPKKKIVAVIPTRTGKHILAHPFNSKHLLVHPLNTAAHRINLESLIKKNNNTLLYENIK
jgi:hypothetical protein